MNGFYNGKNPGMVISSFYSTLSAGRTYVINVPKTASQGSYYVIFLDSDGKAVGIGTFGAKYDY